MTYKLTRQHIEIQEGDTTDAPAGHAKFRFTASGDPEINYDGVSTSLSSSGTVGAGISEHVLTERVTSWRIEIPPVGWPSMRFIFMLRDTNNSTSNTAKMYFNDDRIDGSYAMNVGYFGSNNNYFVGSSAFFHLLSASDTVSPTSGGFYCMTVIELLRPRTQHQVYGGNIRVSGIHNSNYPAYGSLHYLYGPDIDITSMTIEPDNGASFLPGSFVSIVGARI